jgi:glycosyltransferase involved in cell wall biosynthesis
MNESPEIVVIVPIRQAQLTIRQTLEGLSAQCEDCNAEVIAVVSESDGTSRLLRGFRAPRVRVQIQPAGLGIPQLRRDGVLLAARAPYLVITEDHCTFPDGWLRRMAKEIRERGGVIGGPVLNGNRTFIGWAQYFTRYSAFLTPASPGATSALPGNNAIYSRAEIAPYFPLLKEGFWEAEFNHALQAAKHPFRMEPDLAVEQHQERGAFAYMSLRYRHGRCYGWRRSRDATPWTRWRLLAVVPVVPLLLYLRAARKVFAKSGYAGMFLLTTPLLLCYFGAWAAGEAAGYLWGPGADSWDTD